VAQRLASLPGYNMWIQGRCIVLWGGLCMNVLPWRSPRILACLERTPISFTFHNGTLGDAVWTPIGVNVKLCDHRSGSEIGLRHLCRATVMVLCHVSSNATINCVLPDLLVLLGVAARLQRDATEFNWSHQVVDEHVPRLDRTRCPHCGSFNASLRGHNIDTTEFGQFERSHTAQQSNSTFHCGT